MVLKLSSNNINPADSFATSVPFSPIATPMSACFKAGESFIPSPVIATMCPLLCSASTIFNLYSGVVLAKTLILSTFSANL